VGFALKDQVKYGLKQLVFAPYLSKLSTQSSWNRLKSLDYPLLNQTVVGK